MVHRYLHLMTLSRYFAVLLLISVSAMLLMPSAVFAETSAEGKTYFENINNNYYSQKIVNDCYAQSKPDTFNQSDAENYWVWMGHNNTGGGVGVGIGRTVSPDNGWVQCYDQNAIQNAVVTFMQYAGYDSANTFISQLGYVKTQITISQNKGNCLAYAQGQGALQPCIQWEFDPPIKTTTDVYTLNGAQPNMQRAIWSHTPVQTDPARYYALDAIFARECIAPDSSTDATMSITRKIVVEDPAGSGKYSSKQTSTKIFATTGTTTTWGGSTTTQTKPKTISAYDYNNRDTDCQKLATEMDGLVQAVVDFNKAHLSMALTSSTAAGGTTSGNSATCVGGALGWILCPLADAVTSATTTISNYLDGILKYSPLILGNGTQFAAGNSIYGIWRIVVGPANLALVIAFLVVIFSQATSIGLSAYGIKKMLPRIIAAAILINLSFFVCGIAVDIANILGTSVKDIIQSVPIDGADLRHANFGENLNVIMMSITTGVVLAVTGAIFYILPMVLSAFLAVLTALVIIAARQVLITLFIIISPLAFAALILPNTNDLFNKWRKAFIALLAMYPLIMLMFYGSVLVSQVIGITSLKDNDETIKTFTQVIQLVVLIIPLFALPTIMKMAGGILERFGGFVNDKSKGLIDRSRNWAKGKQDRSTFSQVMKSRKAAGDANAQQRAYRRMGKGVVGEASRFGMFGNTKQLLDTQINEANDKIHAQQVGFAKQSVSQKYNASDGEQRRRMAQEAIVAANRGDQVKLDALMSHAAAVGADEFADVYNQVQGGIDTKGAAGSTLGKSNRYISAAHGAELGQKNRGLSTMLQTGDPTAKISDMMYNDDGIRTYYQRMSADKVSNFSSDTAKAAAQFLDDDVLEKVIYDPNTSKNVGTSAMKAYRDEYAARLGLGGNKVEQGYIAEYQKSGGQFVLDQNGQKIVTKAASTARKPDDLKDRGNLLPLTPPPRPNKGSGVTPPPQYPSPWQAQSGNPPTPPTPNPGP